MAVAVVMGIFPPWIRIRHTATPISHASPTEMVSDEPAGYAPLCKPPEASFPQGWYSESVRLDYSRLTIQFAILALVVGAGLVTFKDSDKRSLSEWLESLSQSAGGTKPKQMAMYMYNIRGGDGK